MTGIEQLPKKGAGQTQISSTRPSGGESSGFPQLRSIQPEVTDIQTTVEMFITDVKKSGLLEKQELSEIPAASLPQDYYDLIRKPLRYEMHTLTPDGQKVAIHLISIWKNYHGYDGDARICLCYPDLFPGAPSFSTLVHEFSPLMRQLQFEDADVIYHFYHAALVENDPKVILDLLP